MSFNDMRARSIGEWEEEDGLKRKAVLVMIVTLLLINMLTLAFNIQPVNAEPGTWTVDDDKVECPDADFTSIQEAIIAASEGDSIYVYNGTYHEHPVVNKPLSLFGESKKSTIVDGSGENRTVIEVTANNVVVSGFTVQNTSRAPGTSHAGIKVSRRACNITGNHVTRNKIGVFVASQKSRIAENIVTKNGQGIALYDSSEVTVEANNASANTLGISLAYSSNNMIVGNRAANSSKGGHGIHLSSNSSYNTIESNDLVNNSHGMWLDNSFNNWVANNNIANNELLGIELDSSSSNIFYHNHFINNGPTHMRHVVIDSKSLNIWDDGYPSGGNYWGDYIDVDEKSGPNQDQPESDGIWDNPYVINDDNLDRYPFVYVYDMTKPTANAGPDQTVNVGTLVFFDASGSTDNVGIVSHEWDFGDGTSGTGITCNHTYTEPRNYTVTLSVRDAAGNFDTDSVTITVRARTHSVKVSPFWKVDVIAVVIGIAIVATLFWKYRVSKKGRKARMRARKTSLRKEN